MREKTLNILQAAQKRGYAVGAFNVTNLETIQAVVEGANRLKSPCIIQATNKTMVYLGDKILGEMVNLVIENNSDKKTPIGFHLDHGASLDEVIRAIDLGMDSVMIDASRKNFQENLRITQQVVAYAHKRGVAVQAELGNVPYLGREEQNINWEEFMTDPEEAKQLVEESGVDALAVGIGNAHGFFRERELPDWDRLIKIKKLIPNIPLILHGASDWSAEKVSQAVDRGITCFNVDTDLRIAFITSLRDSLKDDYGLVDPRKVLSKAREKVQEKVQEKILMFARKK